MSNVIFRETFLSELSHRLGGGAVHRKQQDNGWVFTHRSRRVFVSDIAQKSTNTTSFFEWLVRKLEE